MSQTVYIITDGEYSDYRILGVALTREDAEFFVAKFGGSIEEYEDRIFAFREGWAYYEVQMDKTGYAVSSAGVFPPGRGGPRPVNVDFSFDKQRFFTHCWAKSTDHAVKIANERRLQILVADAWGKDLAVFKWVS